ncbi:rhamnogalacturonan lyase [Pectobacterium brasiliense]|uniref:rhamnogalacturonan lyase n=1 Tax=Pectobacterium brasiliense TaxID=180957 RepID=UPI001CE163C9|nr:rhamnogalacturonan lyase [Pectobacterium brasiliense]MCA5920541.1 rhamnogalacturonan lyase [Pectobacterium brasiliense]MCA5927400.1 rhamnogalacturonan lyase [Pectobacterium brasiliense]MCA5936563.1 rhamnogalacturonan lyase [Pectobacterium brasiliense]MCA5940471.1 rhamnogalacturonan lyase [Pectobacterium brasiliense]MCA5945483.1 rhamnogalacturonan lyase [Pectobacterium brasiliense]
MKRYLSTPRAGVIAVTLLATLMGGGQDGLMTSAYAAGKSKQIELLDRGLFAFKSSKHVFLSWRLFATDPENIAFNLYRDGQLINPSPLSTTTNFIDPDGKADSIYSIRPVIKGIEGKEDVAKSVLNGQRYQSIPLKKPADGVTPKGDAYSYGVNDGSVGDLDGDREYEYVIKWAPSNSKDNSHSGYTGNVYIDAYKQDGTRLWRIDLGRNIRSGAHYNDFIVYDLDGDGKAEVMMKTADGTVDGTGKVIGNSQVDYRNANGRVLTGPEYITVFNGKTGKAMATTDYVPERGDVCGWGDCYGNRVDRFLAGVAYLDGERPSAIFSRGYYQRAVVVAWDWRNGKLTKRWTYDSGSSGDVLNTAYGQGAHHLRTGDADGDGKDDIIFGAATIGSNGKLLNSTGLGHGDALHFGVLDPSRAGKQVFMVHESANQYGNNAMEMHDAATGKILWGYSNGSGGDNGRGVCMDVDPAHLGVECWSSQGGLFNAKGELISDKKPSQINFAIWWDGDLLRETWDRATIDKWIPAKEKTERVFSAYTYHSGTWINGTKATPVLSADLFGDWREEFIIPKSDSSELQIFSTTSETTYRMPTLMHNPAYRTQVAAQNAGYNQPPHTSFYLGEGMTFPVKWESVYTVPK